YLLRLEKLPQDPGKLRARGRDRFHSVQQLTDRHRLVRPNRVIQSEQAHFRDAHGPLREVARVDELTRIVRLVRRQHFAALIDAGRPPREAIGSIEWSDDEAR